MSTLDRIVAGGYEPALDERFAGPELDAGVWIPHHLPHWSGTARSAARYRLGPAGLELRIDADQAPWCPELDGSTRVSSLQTGIGSGPVGSAIGQHRFHPDAVVREEHPTRALHAPHLGVIATRLRATSDPACMVALWMIGLEDRPERSAEICVCEIFGRDVSRDGAAIGMGVHPFGDPDLVDDFEQVAVPIDVTAPHEYAVEWTVERCRFFVDGEPVKVVDQSPRYPMQLMLGLYELGGGDRVGPHPKRARVEWVRTYRPRAAA